MLLLYFFGCYIIIFQRQLRRAGNLKVDPFNWVMDPATPVSRPWVWSMISGASLLRMRLSDPWQHNNVNNSYNSSATRLIFDAILMPSWLTCVLKVCSASNFIYFGHAQHRTVSLPNRQQNILDLWDMFVPADVTFPLRSVLRLIRMRPITSDKRRIKLGGAS